MKPITLEWVAKAEGDFAVLERESRVRKKPNYDDICFHAQQCAEKYLKARLCEADIPFPKTHSLTSLLDQAMSVEPLWDALREQLAYLSVYAVDFRYPGLFADKQQALQARKLCREFRKAARHALRMDS
jgi:HEPN domain-containing protein